MTVTCIMLLILLLGNIDVFVAIKSILAVVHMYMYTDISISEDILKQTLAYVHCVYAYARRWRQVINLL